MSATHAISKRYSSPDDELDSQVNWRLAGDPPQHQALNNMHGKHTTNESINISASSGYNSHRSSANNSNNNTRSDHTRFHKSARQELLSSPADDVEKQYRQRQLVMKAPMVPMMIDDEPGLIDDDRQPSDDCIHLNQHEKYHRHVDHCVDSDEYHHLQANLKSGSHTNYGNRLMPKLHHVMPDLQPLSHHYNSRPLAGSKSLGSIYQQPNNQHRTFSYIAPDHHHNATSERPYFIHTQHRLDRHTRDHKRARKQVEKSSQSSGSGSSGPLIKYNFGHTKTANMRDSRQHLTSPEAVSQAQAQSQHHQHHHLHPSQHSSQLHHSSKRKIASKSSSRKHSTPATMASNNNKPSLGCCGNIAKLLLFMTNVLFWSSGVALGVWGVLSLVEDHKYNLSQLLVFEPNNKMSLFQLLSWSFITLGCATFLVGFCGCSALLKNNRWILGLYIFLILAIFALDLATGLLAIIFQERLIANVRLRLVNKLRSDYGVQASFTAAVDYIQTKYECCGLEGHFDYDQSLWRLQRLGGFEATVARTCCQLRNTFDDQAHINPRPVNESMCQSTDVRFHQSYRYRKGCLDDLERLVRQKIWIFTIGCGAVGGIILLSLLFATCFCRSIPSHNSRRNSSPTREAPALKKQALNLASHHQGHKQDSQQRYYR